MAAVPVASVSTSHIESWLGSLRLANASRARYYEALRGLFERFVAQGALQRNPCSGIKKPKRDLVRKRVLSLAETQRLLRVVPASLGLAVRLALHGLRRGEVCGLRFTDYEDGGVWVRRTIIEAPNVQVKDCTKNGKDRWVPLDAETARLLKSENGGSQSYCVTTGSGRQATTPMAPSRLSKMFRQAVKGTEFEGIGLHNLRHSFATELQRKGTPVRVAAEILGHSPEVLARVYSQATMEDKRKAIARLKVP